MEYCEELRHMEGIKDLYDLRKETIERNFGTAKEFHGMRYTQMKGKDGHESCPDVYVHEYQEAGTVVIPQWKNAFKRAWKRPCICLNIQHFCCQAAR